MSLQVIYGNFAPEAKENFTASITPTPLFFHPNDFSRYNVNYNNYGNPCEYGTVLLDGNSEPFPSSMDDTPIGLWSSDLSDSSGDFANHIVIEFDSKSGYFSSQGITLTFDTYNNIYATDISIQWWQDSTLLQSQDYTPDNAMFYCENDVESYDSIRITIKSINMPNCRLRFRAIDFGYGTIFGADEISSLTISQGMNLISEEIASTPIDFELNSKGNIEYKFQNKQPITIKYNDKLIATTFVTKSTRQSKYRWQIETDDYIGMLSKLTFLGGMYVNAPLYNNDPDDLGLLNKIFTQAKIPFTLSEDLQNVKVSGYIPICDCREALRQILFAVGAVVSTTYSDVVKIYKLDSSDTRKDIPLSSVKQGQQLEENEIVTEVNLTAYEYEEHTEYTDLYTAESNQTELFVTFSEPAHNLRVVQQGHTTPVEDAIIDFGTNWAIINIRAGYVLQGQGYIVHQSIMTKSNPITSITLGNVVDISDMTLISSNNVDTILQLVYNYLIQDKKLVTSIYDLTSEFVPTIFGEHLFGECFFGGIEKDVDMGLDLDIGDIVLVPTEFYGDFVGRITSCKFNLNGNRLLKECEVIEWNTL